MIPIYLKHDLPEDFVNMWHVNLQPYMVRGWKTWITQEQAEYVRLQRGTLHPEGNKYTTNFLAEYFSFDTPLTLDKFFEL